MSGSPIVVGQSDAIDAKAIAQVWSGFGRAELVSVRRLHGRSHRVYDCADRAGRHWILRLAVPQRARFDVEAEVITHCARAGLPVPIVEYAAVEDVDGSPVAVMIQHKADGQPLGQVVQHQASSRDLLRQAGRALAAIHEIRTHGYGPVGPGLIGPAATLGEWFVDGLTTKIEQAQRIAPDSATFINMAAQLINDHRSLIDEQSSHLLHGDYSPANLLVHEGEICAIIDWESAKAGPAGLDIGWWDCFFDTAQTPTDQLIAGYQQVRDIDQTALAALRHLTVLRVMIAHFSWTLSVGDQSGIDIARRRINDELMQSASWRLAGT